MTLTSGHGPLSSSRRGRFSPPIPDGTVYVEAFRRRVRALVDGRTVIDSERALLVHRPDAAPTWAFPRDDVVVPARPTPEADGYVEVAWDAVDSWWQENDRVVLHAPNPYHRVDYLTVDRRLRVAVGDVVIVDHAETVGVWETGLEPRLYVTPDAVRTEFLEPSATTTVCPYKGTASYWSIRVGDDVVPDAVWIYRDPTPEATAIAGMMSFWGDALTIEADLPGPADV